MVLRLKKKDFALKLQRNDLEPYERKFIQYLENYAVRNSTRKITDISVDPIKNGIETILLQNNNDISDKKLRKKMLKYGYINDKKKFKDIKKKYDLDKIKKNIDQKLKQVSKIKKGLKPITVKQYFEQVGEHDCKVSDCQNMKKMKGLKLPEYEKKSGVKNRIYNSILQWNWFVYFYKKNKDKFDDLIKLKVVKYIKNDLEKKEQNKIKRKQKKEQEKKENEEKIRKEQEIKDKKRKEEEDKRWAKLVEKKNKALQYYKEKKLNQNKLNGGKKKKKIKSKKK